MKQLNSSYLRLSICISIILICLVQPAFALIISEIMYNPTDEKLEFIELYNPRAVFEDLGGYSFTQGIEYTFPPGLTLEAKGTLVVALDPESLKMAYKIDTVLGPYEGRLSNGGERITLANPNGGAVLSFRYRDCFPWPIAADGTGHSMVLPSPSADPEQGANWIASDFMGGTPGVFTKGSSLPKGGLRINELLTRSSSPDGTDWIELYNAGSVAIDLSYLYLSDDATDLLKLPVAGAVSLEPGSFWTIDLGTQAGGTSFALNGSGEAIYLTQASIDPDPIPIRVLDCVRFGALPDDRTLGRFPDGSPYLHMLEAASPGLNNSKPWVHEVVINEVMYHHGLRDERYEYIELYNRGSQAVSLDAWAFTDGIDFEFPAGITLAPDAYLVVAKDPNLLMSVYDHLVLDQTLFGPYKGGLDDYSERICLAFPQDATDPTTDYVTVDELTYFDGGRWPVWADGQGSSLELRNPHGENNTPDAWAASDESQKSLWVPFSFTIDEDDDKYTHDQVNLFDMMLLNRGEVLLDDIQVNIKGKSYLTNGDFEDGLSSWRVLGNHVRSFVTSAEAYGGGHSLHLIATGHGDPGANRINQSIKQVTGGTVTFSGYAKWLRGSRYLLLRNVRDRKPVQPPRPSHAFELDMPLDHGTPGQRNSVYVVNRGPDIREVQHQPVMPRSGQSVTVSARVTDRDLIASVILAYRSEGNQSFTNVSMQDDGQGSDLVAGDGLYTAVIPPASNGTMRAFRIHATDEQGGEEIFPTPLDATAEVPDRTCLIRVGDTAVDSPFVRYRVWLSDDVIDTFRSRPNLSNELMDCTFVYNETEVFYNARIRFRGSPFLRGGSNRDPRGRYGFRITFNPDQRFGMRCEINLDNTEGSNRGPLQERASYWFYRKMGLPYSRQEFIRLVTNGNSHGNYEDVQKIDGDYIQAWFPDDNDGYIHKVDDYFEYSVDGTSKSNLDEGLKYDSRHPLIPETYRWGFEKRSHRNNDNWEHLFDFAVAMNTPEQGEAYEAAIESMMDPDYFVRVLAIRHAVGDWDSYGYDRGKNNYFYYAIQEGKWYLLPWDIDFTLGSGRNASANLFSINGGKFPEVQRFLNHPKYRELYLGAFSELVSGPWRTSYGTNNSPTMFDRFLDDAANALIADGMGSGRRDGIKQFVRDRRHYILTQVPSIEFKVMTSDGQAYTAIVDERVILQGVAPQTITRIAVNEVEVPVHFTSKYGFEIEVPVDMGLNRLHVQGLDQAGYPVGGAENTIIIVRVEPFVINSITPSVISTQGGLTDIVVSGSGYMPGSDHAIVFTKGSQELGFDAQYVQSKEAFDRIDAATLLLDESSTEANTEYGTHLWINLSSPPGQGEFSNQELDFIAPFENGGTNYAIRFSGVIVVPSPGVRYFGINSDDGFSLKINDVLVGEYGDVRGPATTDVTRNRTAGTMSYNFPAAGQYPIVIDFFENGGGEAIEFFQTNATGGDRRLINVDAELTVMRSHAQRIEAINVVVVDSKTIHCQINATGKETGSWKATLIPPLGPSASFELVNALQVIE